jgi:hypothetical protein
MKNKIAIISNNKGICVWNKSAGGVLLWVLNF